LFDMLDVEGEALAGELRSQGHAAAYWHVDVTSETQVAVPSQPWLRNSATCMCW
jgi:hypothetical protein